MNERLEELSKEAWRQIDVSKIRGRHPAYTKIFAELIIKDCLALIDKRREFCSVAGEYESREYYACMIAKECAFEEAADEIKYHFAVKL
jgi:hypothetical protein